MYIQKYFDLIFRIVGYGISGCEPSIMGIGPVPAIRALMEKTGLTLEEIEEVTKKTSIFLMFWDSSILGGNYASLY